MLKTVIRIALALFILVIAIVIAAVMLNGDSGSQGDAVETPATEVSALVVTSDNWAPQAEWVGEVTTRQRTDITVPLAAEVNAVSVDVGQRVEAGDPLLDLDTREAEWDLALVREELRDLEVSRAQMLAQHELDRDMLALERELLTQAERSLSREQGLRDRGASTEAALEDARGRVIQARQSLRQREASVSNHENDLAQLDSQLARARVNLERREDALARSNPVAPFSGIIEEVHVAAGQRVSAGQALMSVYGVDSLKWRVILPRSVQGDLQAYIDGQWMALERRSASVSEGASSRYGEFTLPSDTTWGAGEIHEARVQWPGMDNTQLIPSSSLYSGNRIFLIDDDDQLQSLVVDPLGARWHNGTEYWIIDAQALPEDARILTTRLANVLSGMPVSVVDTDRLTADSTGD